MTHCDTLWYIATQCYIFLCWKAPNRLYQFVIQNSCLMWQNFVEDFLFFLFERKTQNFAQEYFWPVFSFLEEKNNCLMVRYMCFYQVIVFTHSENQGFGQAKLGFSGLVLSSSQYSPLPNLLPKCHSFQKWSKGT